MRRSTDFLKEFQVVVLIGLAAVAIGTVVGVVDLLNGGPIPADLMMRLSAEAGLPEGVRASPPGVMEVEIISPTSRQRFLYALTQLPTAIVWLATLSMLAFTLRRARRADPFTSTTVRDLRLTGGALWSGIIAAPAESLASFLLSETLTPDRFGATMQLPVGWFFGGFVCFAVAEIVRRGSRMREDLATVI